MRELFVYYRVESAQADAARRAVQAMQERLRGAHPGLDARLLVRGGGGASLLQTWMETYALPGSPEGVDARLEARIEAAADAWSELRTGPRHVESFDVASGD